jgi:predicted transcriptional regulator of viral defense system
MRMSVLLKKLRIENKEFVTSKELELYCNSMKLDYTTLVRYFIAQGYLIRIFRGIFYVNTLDEMKLGRSKYSHLELVAKGIELKNVKNWYFGLHTALKLNNMTHEYFAVEDVINDSLFRANPMNISGYKFKFTKLSPLLFDFGIKNKDEMVRYSDPEKTVLDFIYIWRYNGVPDDKIVLDISEWAKQGSKEKLMSYAKKYPKTVTEIVEMVIG